MKKLLLITLLLAMILACGDEPKKAGVYDDNTVDNDSTTLPDNSADDSDGSGLNLDNSVDNDTQTPPDKDTAVAPDGDTVVVPDEDNEQPDTPVTDQDNGTTVDEEPNDDDSATSDEVATDSDEVIPTDDDTVVIVDETPDEDTAIDPLGDEDGDGINNGTEGTDDPDGDGIPNYLDDDSDGDGILDSVETADDFDGDGTGNYLDTDSDADGILDEFEGDFDFDKDGFGNYLDLDSDGDTVPDSTEGRLDADGDGYGNFVDMDSDNDGLTDQLEHSIGSNLTSNDTDSDGFDDNVEYAYGEQIDPSHTGAEYVLNPALGIPSDVFYVVLPYEDPEIDKPLDFTTDIKDVDVLIQVDLSGSMDGEITNLKAGISNTVITNIRSSIPNSAFGLATFSDWEGGSYGDAYKLVRSITTDIAAMNSAVASISVKTGGWEAHSEALYQAATGAGYTPNAEICTGTDTWGNCDSWTNLPTIPAYNHQWRNGSLPIIVMITDEEFTTLQSYIDSSSDYRMTGGPAAHSSANAVTAMNAINAKIIGVDSGGGSTHGDYQYIANGTGSKSSTGSYYIYDINSNGTGLSASIANAVSELVSSIPMDVTTLTESISNPQSIDTRDFIKSVTPHHAVPAGDISGSTSTAFLGVIPGTQIFFTVDFQNTIYEPTDTVATLFRAKINVRGQGTTLDTREVLIIVPGKNPTGGSEG